MEVLVATIEEIEKKRADRRKAQDDARDEQIAVDLTAIDALEESGGDPLHTMTANAYKPGVAVKLAFRAPNATEYKRYCDMVGRAQAKNDPIERRRAQEMLAASCMMYPADGEARKAMLDAHPGVLISLAIEAAKVAEARAEDEGKG